MNRRKGTAGADVPVKDIEDKEGSVGDDEQGGKGGKGSANDRLLHHDLAKLLIEDLCSHMTR